MTLWIMLSLGMAFVALMGWVLLHAPTRCFCTALLHLQFLKYPKMGWIFIFGFLGASVISEQYLLVILGEVFLILGMWGYELKQSRRAQRDLAFVQHVAGALTSATSSGLDIYSACKRLEQSLHPPVCMLGKNLRHLFHLGISCPDSLLYHPSWKQNVEFRMFVTTLFDLVRSGANLMLWLERQNTYLHKKLQFRKMLATKTVQIKMQMYVLTMGSWALLGVTMILFPTARTNITTHPVCLQLIGLGIGIQGLGIFVTNWMLGKILEQPS